MLLLVTISATNAMYLYMCNQWLHHRRYIPSWCLCLYLNYKICLQMILYDLWINNVIFVNIGIYCSKWSTQAEIATVFDMDGQFIVFIWNNIISYVIIAWWCLMQCIESPCSICIKFNSNNDFKRGFHVEHFMFPHLKNTPGVTSRTLEYQP